ncbi:MAG: transposase [Candidatus Omnitrophota bacterium]
MPRKPRLVIAKYPHHIILRGNNRSTIFYKDEDKHFFLKCLKESKEKTKSKIYAYCLMTNHVHLLIEPIEEMGLGDMMQSLGRRYVQYINYAQKRTGTLWEGRFKSSLVDKDEYLLMCSRYIELNPVRSGMVKQPGNYIWSSFRHKAEGTDNNVLDADCIYMGLGKTQKERQQKYNKWILESIPEKELEFIRGISQKSGIMGSRKFIDKISDIVGRDVALKERGRSKKSL